MFPDTFLSPEFLKWEKMLLMALIVLSTLIVAKVSKLFLKRRHFSRILPGQKFRFYKLSGNAGDLLYNENKKLMGHNPWLLQLLGGLAKLFKKDKMFTVWVLHYPFVFLTTAEAVEDTLSGTKIIEKNFMYKFLHPWLNTGLLTSGGSKWKSRRKLLTPAFHFDILKDFMPVFNEQAQRLVQLIKQDTNKEFINITQPITLCSLDIICETTLGVSINAQNNCQSEYVKAVARVTELIMERMTNYYVWFDFIFYRTEKGKQLRKDLKILHDFTRSVIQEKKEKLKNQQNSLEIQKKRKALMDTLLEQNIQTKSLTDEDIREEVDTFAFEGHDTTSMGMSWCLYLLGLNKDVQDKVISELDSIFGDDTERAVTTEDLKDMKYLDCVLKECLRLYPSVPIIAREVTTDINICRYDIPKGATCFVVPYTIHRDEDIFPNPEKFDPDRFSPENSANRHPYAYIPFSAGPRNCIGQRFALMEEKVVISTILRNFTLHSLDHRDKILMSMDLILRPVGPLRMQIQQRK